KSTCLDTPRIAFYLAGVLGLGGLPLTTTSIIELGVSVKSLRTSLFEHILNLATPSVSSLETMLQVVYRIFTQPCGWSQEDVERELGYLRETILATPESRFEEEVTNFTYPYHNGLFAHIKRESLHNFNFEEAKDYVEQAFRNPKEFVFT